MLHLTLKKLCPVALLSLNSEVLKTSVTSKLVCVKDRERKTGKVVPLSS